MAKLSKEIVIPIKLDDGEVAKIRLRRPTPAETNVYLGRKIEYVPCKDEKKLRSCEPEARQELFDLLLVSVENLEDDDGPVTKDTPERIPAIWKDQIVQHKIDTMYISLDSKN